MFMALLEICKKPYIKEMRDKIYELKNQVPSFERDMDIMNLEFTLHECMRKEYHAMEREREPHLYNVVQVKRFDEEDRSTSDIVKNFTKDSPSI